MMQTYTNGKGDVSNKCYFEVKSKTPTRLSIFKNAWELILTSPRRLNLQISLFLNYLCKAYTNLLKNKSAT